MHVLDPIAQATAVVSSSLLLMAVMGLLFPAVLHATHTEIHDGSSELTLSRFSSCIMLLAYCCYLYFQLKSHRELYDEPQEVSAKIQNSRIDPFFYLQMYQLGQLEAPPKESIIED